MIGRRPRAAFGNSIGDREMLEWTTAVGGARLEMLVLHDDAEREYAYGPVEGMSKPRVGAFTKELRDEAKKSKREWTLSLRDETVVDPIRNVSNEPAPAGGHRPFPADCGRPRSPPARAGWRHNRKSAVG
jgi:hypothetical protein